MSPPAEKNGKSIEMKTLCMWWKCKQASERAATILFFIPFYYPCCIKKIAQSAIAIVNEAAYTFHTESHRFQSFSQMKKSIAKIQCTRIPTHPKKIERAREWVKYKNGLTKRKMRTEKFAEHNGKNLVAITKTQQVDKFQFENRRTASSSSYVKAILFASHFISLVASVAAANV